MLQVLLSQLSSLRSRRGGPQSAPTIELQKQWTEKGYAHLKSVVDPKLIDELLADLKVFRGSCGETKDECGFGGRIGLFHIENKKSLEVAFNQKVQNFLKWAFHSDPILFGSLSFEVGTEQSAHRDNIFFYTQPATAMAGAWTALEEVDADAGPLFYYPGSHLWPVIRGQDVIAAFPELSQKYELARNQKLSPEETAAVISEIANCWHELTRQQILERNAKPEPVLIKKGDVLIWHGLLVHGGLPRTNRKISRNSMVVHYIAKNCDFWDHNSYILLKNQEFNSENKLNMKPKKVSSGHFIEHDKPVTY